MCSMTVLLLSVIAAIVWPQVAHGHGYITSPAARNYNPNDGFYDDMAGNGAGLPVRFNPNPGMCGDPFQGHTSTNFAGIVGPIRATYTAGQYITTTQTLTANHGGYLRLKLCPSSPTSATQSCFDSNVLQGPNGSRFWLTSGTYMNSPPYTITWKLPDGVTCTNGCLLQWEYTAMQSCIEDCSSSVCGNEYANKRNPITGQTGMPSCPTSAGPEFFRNCVDIRINSISGTAPAPAPATAPAPAPATAPASAPVSGNKCDKCNVAVCKGGCKCDSNCDCKAGLGGSACDKCNLAQSEGGCKCDSNCNCTSGSCWF